MTELGSGKKAFVSFELFEHLHNPKLFLERVNTLMNAGDIFIFTTLSGLGLDIQLLWENSKSITPPYHINFFNPHSVKILTETIGLKILEITTPGKLDMDIVLNNKEFVHDRFWSKFIKYTSNQNKEKWQALLAESGWSSHMMVVCQKI